MIKFFTKYDRPKAVKSPCGKISMTDPQYRDECDVNKVLAKYGCLPDTVKNFKPLDFGDFTDCGDFGVMLDKVQSAEAQFMSMPSSVRSRFGNDPVAFFEFVQDPSNIDEMVKLGIAKKRPVKKVEMPVTDENPRGSAVAPEVAS